MTKFAAKSVNTKIPVQLNENEFEQFILPYLSMPIRGPEYKIGYWKVFNYILKFLYPGMQCKQLPIEKNANGDPEIHHTVIFKQYGK